MPFLFIFFEKKQLKFFLFVLSNHFVSQILNFCFIFNILKFKDDEKKITSERFYFFLLRKLDFFCYILILFIIINFTFKIFIFLIICVVAVPLFAFHCCRCCLELKFYPYFCVIFIMFDFFKPKKICVQFHSHQQNSQLPSNKPSVSISILVVSSMCRLFFMYCPIAAYAR